MELFAIGFLIQIILLIWFVDSIGKIKVYLRDIRDNTSYLRDTRDNTNRTERP